MKTSANKIHIILTVPDKKYFILALCVAIFIAGSVLAYSALLKKQGDIQYKNGDYIKALEIYTKAQKWWLPVVINLKLRDRELYSKLEKTRIMIRSSELFNKGKKAFEEKQYSIARKYLTNLAEKDPRNKEAREILVNIEKLLSVKPTPIFSPVTSQVLNTFPTPVVVIASYNYDSYYPIILSLSDNKGGQIKYSDYNQYPYSSKNTGITLKVGDSIRWKAEVSDPKGRQILYGFTSNSQRFTDLFGRENGNCKYTTNNEVEFTITGEDIKEIGESLRIVLQVRSEKDNYRTGGECGYDDSTYLDYKLQHN